MHESKLRQCSVLAVVLLLIAVGLWMVLVAWKGEAGRNTGPSDPSLDSDETQLDAPAPEGGETDSSIRTELSGHTHESDRPTVGSLRIEMVYADGTPGVGLVATIFPVGLGLDAPSPRRTGHRSDAGGVVEKSGLTPGDYLVNIAHPMRIYERAKIEAGQQVVLRIRFDRGFTVRGEVVDREGQMVAGARVFSVLGGRWGFRGPPIAISDEFGRFVLQDVGTFTSIGATADHHSPSPRVQLRGKPGEEVAVRLVMTGPAGGLHGIVMDVEGSPVAGATVWFPNEDLPWRFRGELKGLGATPVHAQTDADGRFEAVGLPPLEITVLAGAEGHGSISQKVEVVAGTTTEVVLRLLQTCGVHGHYLDAAGAPIVGARIHVSSNTVGLMAETATDAEGAYRLVGLTPGQVHLQVGHGGKGRIEELELAAGEDKEFDIREAANRSQRGRLLDHEDRPLVGWSILAVSADRDMASAKTDDEGRFTLEKIKQEHSYRISFSRTDTGAAPPAHTVFGVQATESEHVFRLSSSAALRASIRGRVLDWRGQPVDKVRMRCTHADSWRPTTIKQEPGGRFVTENLTAGRYEFLVVLGEQVRFLPDVQLEPGVDLDLGDIRGGEPGTLSVDFVESGGPRPATATIIEEHGNRIAEFPLAGGKLENYPIAAGVYFLQLHAPGLSSRTHRLSIAGGEHNRVRLPLEVAVARTLKVAFEGVNKYLVRVIQVTVSSGGDVFLSERVPFDTASGATIVHSFPPGRYHVSASTRHGAVAAEEFEITASSAPGKVVALRLR